MFLLAIYLILGTALRRMRRPDEEDKRKGNWTVSWIVFGATALLVATGLFVWSPEPSAVAFVVIQALIVLVLAVLLLRQA